MKEGNVGNLFHESVSPIQQSNSESTDSKKYYLCTHLDYQQLECLNTYCNFGLILLHRIDKQFTCK